MLVRDAANGRGLCRRWRAIKNLLKMRRFFQNEITGGLQTVFIYFPVQGGGAYV